MNKTLFTLLTLLSFLNAGIINGVSVVVNNTPITLYEIDELSSLKSISRNDAMNLLVRKKLEESEARQRNLTVSNEELEQEISILARRNKMSSLEFLKALKSSKGIDSKKLRADLKEQLLKKKLYQSITYSKMKMPSDEEIAEYYRLNSEEFTVASTYEVVQYRAENPRVLQALSKNPLMNAQGVERKNISLKAKQLSPDFIRMLNSTNEQSFSAIVPNQEGGYALYYVQEKKDVQTFELNRVKNVIINSIMENKRELALKNYFQKLRVSADIKVIREPK